MIGIFSSTLRTGDNREMIIPNGAMAAPPVRSFGTRRTMMVLASVKTMTSRRRRICGIIADDRICGSRPGNCRVRAGRFLGQFCGRPWVTAADCWGAVGYHREGAGIDANGVHLGLMDVHCPTKPIEAQAGRVQLAEHEELPGAFLWVAVRKGRDAVAPHGSLTAVVAPGVGWSGAPGQRARYWPIRRMKYIFIVVVQLVPWGTQHGVAPIHG